MYDAAGRQVAASAQADNKLGSIRFDFAEALVGFQHIIYLHAEQGPQLTDPN